MKKVMIVPGDGVGPEIMSATHNVLKAVTDEIEFVRYDAGMKYFEEMGQPMSRSLLDEAKDCDAILLGTFADSDGRRYVNPEEDIVRFLGLTTCIHYIKSIVPGFGTKQIDSFVVTPTDVINNVTEMEDVDGVSRNIRMQYHNSREVFQTTATLAQLHDVSKITCVNYSAHYRITNERYRSNFHSILGSGDYELEDMCIEEFVHRLIKNELDPKAIATSYVDGKLVSSSLTAYMGGTRLTAIEYYDRDSAVFRPAHGPLNELARTDRVNPIGSLMSGSLMLKHFKMFEEAEALENAIQSACRRGYTTEDLGGRTGTKEFVNRVLEFCK